MIKSLTTFFLLSIAAIGFGQNLDESFSKKKMKNDLQVFKDIRLKANSGLYKYRTKAQIDSIYNWAEYEIENATTYLDFYNIICKLTDFEGSLHNNTSLPEKYREHLQKERSGYFPYPIKWIDGKWIVNYEYGDIPLGSEVLEINNIPISKIIKNLYKYYTTDGENTTGKRIGIRKHFSKYYRFNYGQKENFEVVYKPLKSNKTERKTIKSLSCKGYYNNFDNRYSKPYDQIYYTNLEKHEKYNYKTLDSLTGILTINTFSLGDESTKEHKTYAIFLDSIFTKIKTKKLKNLIVDVRQNGGGNDPNDVLTYSYLTSRNFQESKQVWISFNKIPFLKYLDVPAPRFLRPLGVGKFNKHFQKRFPTEKQGKYFISHQETEMKIRKPNKNNFTGNVYLLVSPAVASAGSLFASMVAGNKNTIVIGEETMGGYYGHNGHTSLGYVLPKSKIIIDFSIDNIEQDVPEKENHFYSRGIIPDYGISQNIQDFLDHRDTQMLYTKTLINKDINDYTELIFDEN